MSEGYDRYDARRERCMLDQSSNTATPMHAIVGAPVELGRRYPELPDVAALVRAIGALAASGAPAAEQAAGREKLAARAVELQEKYLAQGRGELSMLLGHAAEYLRGGYPLRPIRALPTIEIGG